MLSCNSIVIPTPNGKREILITPFLLQSKKLPKLKSGRIEKLFFYENWIDEEYKENLSIEYLPDSFKGTDHIINYGQDFGKYYLGGFGIDFDNERCWELDEITDKMSDEDFKILSKALFNKEKLLRQIVVFTPTRPSDFNLGRLEYDL